MADFDIKVHNNNYLSIKDVNKDIDISDAKWNKLFIFLTNLFAASYFRGFRQWGDNKNLLQTLSFLSEETFINHPKRPAEILFRLKSISVIGNRKLLATLWEHYEYPCFIFLGDKIDEISLADYYKNGLVGEDIVDIIENIFLMYRSFEPNVIWIRTNIDIDFILSIFNS